MVDSPLELRGINQGNHRRPVDSLVTTPAHANTVVADAHPGKEGGGDVNTAIIRAGAILVRPEILSVVPEAVGVDVAIQECPGDAEVRSFRQFDDEVEAGGSSK